MLFHLFTPVVLLPWFETQSPIFYSLLILGRAIYMVMLEAVCLSFVLARNIWTFGTVPIISSESRLLVSIAVLILKIIHICRTINHISLEYFVELITLSIVICISPDSGVPVWVWIVMHTTLVCLTCWNITLVCLPIYSFAVMTYTRRNSFWVRLFRNGVISRWIKYKLLS
jgi:hypothetical protein